MYDFLTAEANAEIYEINKICSLYQSIYYKFSNAREKHIESTLNYAIENISDESKVQGIKNNLKLQVFYLTQQHLLKARASFFNYLGVHIGGLTYLDLYDKIANLIENKPEIVKFFDENDLDKDFIDKHRENHSTFFHQINKNLPETLRELSKYSKKDIKDTVLELSSALEKEIAALKEQSNDTKIHEGIDEHINIIINMLKNGEDNKKATIKKIVKYLYKKSLGLDFIHANEFNAADKKRSKIYNITSFKTELINKIIASGMARLITNTIFEN